MRRGIEDLIADIKATIEKFLSEEKKMFVSSSFQTHSIPLLHILSRITPDLPVFFLNTGYHFPETIEFQRRVTEELGLKTTELLSPVGPVHQKDCYGNLLFTSDPDHCCYLNKVLPLRPLLSSYDVWISGVRSDQTSNRAKFTSVMETADGITRYHPMLEWGSREIHEYRMRHQLPEHPLDSEGYMNIGCLPCTAKYYERGHSRWQGMSKSECGLHTTLAQESELKTELSDGVSL